MTFVDNFIKQINEQHFMIQADFILYTLQVACCLLVLLGLYHLSFKKEHFFQWNRWYLLLAPFISSIIPLVQVHWNNHSFWPVLKIRDSKWMQESSALVADVQKTTETQDFVLTISDAVIAIYGLGVLFLGILFLKSLFDTFHHIRLASKDKRHADQSTSSLPRPPKKAFFSTQFWFGEVLSPTENALIRNELSQVRPIHAFDTVMMEVMTVFGWFLPFIHGFRNAFQKNQMFLSDRYFALNNGGGQLFAQNLVGPDEGGNVFHHKSSDARLIQRVNRLTKQPSPGWKKIKYLLVIPVVACLMMLFSSTLPIQNGLQETLGKFSKKTEKWLSTELLHTQGSKREKPMMEWAGKEVPLTIIDEQTDIRFPFHVFDEKEFKKFQTQFPVVYQPDGSILEIENVRISITASDHRNFYNLECSGREMKCLHEALEGMSATSSIQLVFSGKDQQQYYCILTDENKTLYVPNLWYINDPFIFDKPVTLKSYGVEKMSRLTQGYEFIWGPSLKLDIQQKEWHPVTKEELTEAMQHLPALAPIHGGLIGQFSFELTHVKLNQHKNTVKLIVDENASDAYLDQEALKKIMEGLEMEDMIYIENIRLKEGRNLGGFSCKIVEDPSAFARRKWNMANFNFSSGNRSIYQSTLTVEPDQYVLKWGTFFIPLELYASPDYYKAKLEIETEQLIDLVDYPIEVYRNDQKIPSSEVDRLVNLIYFESDDLSIQNISNFTQDGEIRLKENGLDRVKNIVRPGLHLTLNGMIAGINLNGMKIEVVDPDGPYIPPITVYRNRQYSGEEFSFQVIQGVGDQKTIIKIDSSVESTREILSMYKDDSKYEIIQLPGFKTTRRLLTPDLKSLESKPKMLSEDFVDIKYLSERLLTKEDHVYMKWGRMMASPSSGNYSSKEFKYSGRWPIQLMFNDALADVHQMEVKLYSGEKLTHHFLARELPHPIFQKAIQSITSKGTIYITNIVINDDEQKVIFPQDFVFSVE